MKVTDACAAIRLRSAVVVAVASFAVMIGTGLPWSHPAEAHGMHVLQDASVIGDHAHLLPDNECHSAPSDAITCAAVPRAGAVSAAAGPLAVVVVVAALGAWAALVAVRGPPGALAGFYAGRYLLTRLSIARR